MALTRNTPARVILRVPGVGALLVAFAACGGLVGTDDAPAERLHLYMGADARVVIFP